MTPKPKLVPAEPIPSTDRRDEVMEAAFFKQRHPSEASEAPPAPEVEDDGLVTRIGLNAAHDAPAPEQPVMDEAGEYLSGQQSKLDEVRGHRLALATQRQTREEYYVAEHQRLCARRDAELGALADRDGRLARVEAGCVAGIAAVMEA